MRLRFIFYHLSFACLLCISCNNKTYVPPPGNESSFRVLGYLHSDNWLADLDAVDLSRITDLNIAFINPDATGVFPENNVYREMITKAHAQKVRVFLSLGGGNPPAHLGELIKPGKRSVLINNLVSFAANYGFDGIDVDLENALINDDYAPFVSELGGRLQSGKMLMTAALASWNANQIADSTLQRYDLINIMSYDKTGPWNPDKPGQHSPYSMAEADFNYFNVTRKVNAEKLLIGLPFYGYGFGTGAPESMNYKDIVQTYPGAEWKDSVMVTGGGVLYYNGIATIREKINLAIRNKAGGVMIWQLRGDATGDRSLLRVIHEIKNK
jgi:chitinase